MAARGRRDNYTLHCYSETRRLLAVLPVHLPAKRRASVCAIGIRHAQNCLGFIAKDQRPQKLVPLTSEVVEGVSQGPNRSQCCGWSSTVFVGESTEMSHKNTSCRKRSAHSFHPRVVSIGGLGPGRIAYWLDGCGLQNRTCGYSV